MLRYFMVILALVAGFGLGRASFASQDGSGSAPAADPALPYLGPEYEDCGQGCLYKKANEHIMTEADYIAAKIRYLEKVPTARAETLGEFCRPTEGNVSCFARYKYIHSNILIKMRKAAAENDSSRSKLEEIGTGAPGVGKRFIGVVPRATKNNTPKKAHKPYPQTYDDMISSAALLSPEAREMKSRDYDEWVDKVTQPPNKDDFIKYKMIPRNPDYPDGEKMRVIETDNNGHPIPDLAAYNKAMEMYRKALGENDIAGAESKLKNILVGPDDRSGYRADMKADKDRVLDLMKKRKPASAAKADLKKSDADRNVGNDNRHYIYNQVRGDIVKFTNESITRMNNPGQQGARPASGQSQSAPPAGYTGRETVNDIKPRPGESSERGLFIDASPEYYMQLLESELVTPP